MITPYNIKRNTMLSEYSNYRSANHNSDPAPLPSYKHNTTTIIYPATAPVPEICRKSLKQSNNSHVSHTMTPKTFALFGQIIMNLYTGAGKSLARPGRKQATATEDFEVHISSLFS